jgi:photosystem II stability/assembly factor-like uncharacterized protein
MNPMIKRLTSLAGLLVALAGCGKATKPVVPVPIPPLGSIALTPELDTLQVGQTRQFVAVAVDTAGQPYTGPLDWTTSDPGVITVSSSGLVSAAGEGSALVVVTGGGRSDSSRVAVFPAATGWVPQTSNASEDLDAVFFDAAGRRGWVVGAAGLILSTTDAGATWTRRAPVSFDLHGVWFTSAQEGWVVGNGGTVLHTTDSGTSWTRLTSPATSENLMGVYFASRDTGWAVGTNGLIAGTFDRGATWHKTNAGGVTLNGVMFAGTLDGWAVGDGGIILGTHDRGARWFIVQPALTTQALRALWRGSVPFAVAVGAQGAVVRTQATADSVAWSLGNAGSLNALEGVCFPQDGLGWAVGWNGTAGVVLQSVDGGATWNPQVSNSQFRLRGVFFVDERRGWAVGDNGVIRHTSSGGA